MARARPSMFVGSSTEGLKIAKALQVLLDHVCEVTIWSHGVFGLSQGTLESLVNALEEYDFAVLVLTADDLVTSRDAEFVAPRDNVLFELASLWVASAEAEHSSSTTAQLALNCQLILPAFLRLHSSRTRMAIFKARLVRLPLEWRNKLGVLACETESGSNNCPRPRRVLIAQPRKCRSSLNSSRALARLS
jgi:hypothetical protein